MGDTPDGTAPVHEPSLDEQIAVYQREFQDLDPQVEKVVSALSRLNRRMNVAYGRQTAALGISNAEWEVLKALVLSEPRTGWARASSRSSWASRRRR